MDASDVHLATGNMLRKCTIPYKAEELERRKTETMMTLLSISFNNNSIIKDKNWL